MNKRQVVIAVSGKKNSGKTTLIEKLLPILISRDLKVAVIKHDGHDFEPDVPGTDSYRFAKQGAYGIAVFSDHRYMIIKQQKQEQIEKLLQQFPEADLIILEGFKHSNFPKIEVIRRENSVQSVCEEKNLLAIATDLMKEEQKYYSEKIPILNLNEPNEIAEFIYRFYQSAYEDTMK